MNKIYKIIGSNILIAFLSLGFFRYVSYVFNVITPDSFSFNFAAPWTSLAYWREPLAILNFVFLVSAIAISLVIFRQKRLAVINGLVVGLIFIYSFGYGYVNWIGAGLTILLFLAARHDGVEEVNERTKLNPRMIIRRTSTFIVIALFVLVSFVAFQSPVAQGIADSQRLPSASEQLMRSIVKSVISHQVEGSNREKENVINQVTRSTFLQINNILKPYFQYAPPLLAFGLFLVLWGFSWIFVQLSVLAGMLIFWILRKINFIKVEKYNVEAERLVV